MQDPTPFLIRTTTEDCKYSIEPTNESKLMSVHSNGEIISSTSDFQTFWKNVAGEFASNELVIFDTS